MAVSAKDVFAETRPELIEASDLRTRNCSRSMTRLESFARRSTLRGSISDERWVRSRFGRADRRKAG